LKIVVCYKCVPIFEGVPVNKDRTLDLSKTDWEIGPFDLKAVEAGIRFAQAEDQVIALTANGEIVSNTKMKKDILSRGPAQMFGIEDTGMKCADSYATARVLKAGIQKIGGVDLVLCGEGSGDIYAQQVGNVLGGLLGWSTVNSVSVLIKEEGRLRVERDGDNGLEVLEVELPAVITLSSDVNSPRIPTMRDILAAGKKPSTIWSLQDVGASVENGAQVLSILAPETPERKKIVFDAADEASLDQFVAQLKKIF